MEKGMNLFRRIGKLGLYIMLIFSVLALINWGNKRMASAQQSSTVRSDAPEEGTKEL